jgi:hypothetical protein
VNCLHKGACAYERQATGPVFHCELHELPTVTAQAQRPTRPNMPLETGAGLCATCDHRDHCALRSADRIILHCEHYQ